MWGGKLPGRGNVRGEYVRGLVPPTLLGRGTSFAVPGIGLHNSAIQLLDGQLKPCVLSLKKPSYCWQSLRHNKISGSGKPARHNMSSARLTVTNMTYVNFYFTKGVFIATQLNSTDPVEQRTAKSVVFLFMTSRPINWVNCCSRCRIEFSWVELSCVAINTP